jgi:hypothetical protein
MSIDEVIITEQLYNKTHLNNLIKKLTNLHIDSAQETKLKSINKCRNKTTAYGSISISYALSPSMPGRLGYGRYISNGAIGFEFLQTEIRNYICSEYYTDIDIVNCHPVIACQYSRLKFNRPLLNLEKYVANREFYFEIMKNKAKLSCEQVKELILRLMYNGPVMENITLPDLETINMPQEILDIKDDIKMLTKFIIASGEHQLLINHLTNIKKKNMNGSLLSFIFQTEERACLKAMIKCFIENSLRPDVLCYDGCLVRGKDISDECLREAEAKVKQDTGYDITLKVKPWDSLNIEELNEDETEYLQMKIKWEENHFYFSETNSIVAESKDGYRHYGIEHAMECFGNVWKLTGKDGKEESFLAKWRKDPKRRTITDFVYKYKEDCAHYEATLFTGFEYMCHENATYDPEVIERFNELLLNLGNGCPIQHQFLLKLFAFRIKKPFEKANICTIFTGPQGVGKDTVLEFMQIIIGRKYCSMYLSDTEFWEKHDTKKEGALMMYLQEAGVSTNKTNSNALKSRITAPYIDVNPKGLKSYKVPNMAMYFMTTNESSPVKMEENDRRYYLLRAGKKNMGNTQYWKNIYTKMNTPSWIWTLGKYLECINIDDFNPNEFPETEERAVMKEMGQCPEKIFLEQFDWADNKYSCTELYTCYVTFCIENKLPYRQTSNSFGRELTKYLNDLVKRRILDGKSVYCKV